VDTQWQLVINGIIIIAAVAFDELRRKKIWCIILQKEEIIHVKSK
jgi:ribose/xylose/arabinose/galactoside ABC-type transport system permease subunit